MPKATDELMMYAKYKFIFERYKFWSDIKRRREDDILIILQYQECFVGEATILKVLKTFEPDPAMERKLAALLNPKLLKMNPNQSKLFEE